MAVYTIIPSGDRDPESPVTPELIDGLYFNPTAIMEKASGAPVLANNYIVAAMINNGEVTGAKVDSVGTGAGILSAANTNRSSTSTSYVKVKEILCPVGGDYTVDFGIYTNNPAAPAFGRIYINGLAVGTERSTTSTGVVTFSESIAVSSGDLVQLYYHSSGGNAAYVEDFKVKIGSGGVQAATLID